MALQAFEIDGHFRCTLIAEFAQNFRRVVEPWVSWMGLTPDGSPLLMRDTGSQQVYALDFEEP